MRRLSVYGIGRRPVAWTYSCLLGNMKFRDTDEVESDVGAASALQLQSGKASLPLRTLLI